MSVAKKIGRASSAVIVDVEATCSNDGSVPRNEMEIIEIGAVKADHRGRIIETFDIFISPVLHPKLTDFCKRLTGITQEMVDNAPRFPEAFRKFMKFFGDADLLISWGNFDYIIFNEDFARHKKRGELEEYTEFPIPSSRFVNLKEAAVFVVPRKYSGFKGAMRYFGLKFKGRRHRGIDDAVNIARIYREIHRLLRKF